MSIEAYRKWFFSTDTDSRDRKLLLSENTNCPGYVNAYGWGCRVETKDLDKKEYPPEGVYIKIIRTAWGVCNLNGKIGKVLPKDYMAVHGYSKHFYDGVKVRLIESGETWNIGQPEDIEVEILTYKKEGELWDYESLKRVINDIKPETSLRLIDDIIQTIGESRAGDFGFFSSLDIPLSDKGTTSIILKSTGEDGFFSFTNQCEKLAALKKALLRLLENSEYCRKKEKYYSRGDIFLCDGTYEAILSQVDDGMLYAFICPDGNRWCPAKKIEAPNPVSIKLSEIQKISESVKFLRKGNKTESGGDIKTFKEL